MDRANRRSGPAGVSLEVARAAKTEALRRYGSRLTVIGGIGIARVGAGYGVRVNLSVPDPAIPSEIGGAPVIARVVGPVTALAEITPAQEAEHERHAALGENHWFTCPLCDDEQDE